MPRPAGTYKLAVVTKNANTVAGTEGPLSDAVTLGELI